MIPSLHTYATKMQAKRPGAPFSANYFGQCFSQFCCSFWELISAILVTILVTLANLGQICQYEKIYGVLSHLRTFCTSLAFLATLVACLGHSPVIFRHFGSFCGIFRPFLSLNGHFGSFGVFEGRSEQVLTIPPFDDDPTLITTSGLSTISKSDNDPEPWPTPHS